MARFIAFIALRDGLAGHPERQGNDSLGSKRGRSRDHSRQIEEMGVNPCLLLASESLNSRGILSDVCLMFCLMLKLPTALGDICGGTVRPLSG